MVDYRALNRITKRTNTSFPRTDGMFGRLNQARFFSKLYLKTIFHQISIHPDDIEKTAFRTKYGQFEYTVLAVGLCNAHEIFKTLMNSIFRDLINEAMVLHFDYLLTFSNTESEQRRHLEIVLKRLKQHSLFISRKRCDLFQDEVEFTGLIAG